MREDPLDDKLPLLQPRSGLQEVRHVEALDEPPLPALALLLPEAGQARRRTQLLVPLRPCASLLDGAGCRRLASRPRGRARSPRT